MITLLLHLFRVLPFLFGSHRQLALENLALRQQLAVYKRTVTSTQTPHDGSPLVGRAGQSLGRWRQSLVIVTPDTVLRWQRRRFREYWTRLSGRTTGGRPPVNAEIRALIGRMAVANPLWGAPRIHGEILKLGLEVAERTVSRLMPKRRPEPSQTWRTFLANHVRDLVSIDFFTVPTARLRVLFVLVVLAHHRRRVVHFNVTEHPTAAWTAQQIVDAFPEDSTPSYLLRDRDQVFGEQFRHRVKGMGIDEVLTAPHSPWQNPFAERLIGSIRRECLNHVLVLGERHLRRILTRYSSTTIGRARTSRSTRTHPTSGLSRFPPRARSWTFQKSAACTTATSARPPSPPPARKDHNHDRSTSTLTRPTVLRSSEPCRTVTAWSITSGRRPPLPRQPSPCWSPSGESTAPPNESDEVMAKDRRSPSVPGATGLCELSHPRPALITSSAAR